MPERSSALEGLAERFWAKVDRRGPDECWPWLSSTRGTKGYGRLREIPGGPHQLMAHRIAYELAYGPIPVGKQIDHTCHNDSGCAGGDNCPHRACQNPAHLEAVTPKANVDRGLSPLRSALRQLVKTHCPHGHEYSPENTYRRPGRINRFCRACMRIRDVARRKARKELLG